MTYRIKISVSNDAKTALADLGRSEDVKFSPDNRRLALAGYTTNEILIVGASIDESPAGKRVTLSDAMILSSPSLKRPHGLSFVDDRTLVVANRAGDASILKLPELRPGRTSFELPAVQTIRADHAQLLKSPGSVTADRIGPELFEILVCNNYAHNVTRHYLDAREGFRVIGNEVLLGKGLNIPDGIAVNRERSWIAVSNHEGMNVLMFEDVPGLDRSSEAGGILRAANYPHGVCFSADDQFVLVADAGSPHFRVYAKAGADWRGERDPIATVRVMDEETFTRGHRNPQEGGPKGLDIAHRMNVVATTCEEQPLAFFDLEAILKEHARDGRTAPARRSDPGGSPRDAELSRRVLVREMLRKTNTGAGTALKRAVRDELMRLDHQSRSWRISPPLRWAFSLLPRLASKIRRAASAAWGSNGAALQE